MVWWRAEASLWASCGLEYVCVAVPCAGKELCGAGCHLREKDGEGGVQDVSFVLQQLLGGRDGDNFSS